MWESKNLKTESNKFKCVCVNEIKKQNVKKMLWYE